MKSCVFLLWCVVAAAAMAQSAPPSQPAAVPAPPASAGQVNALLEQVEKTAQDMQADLSRLRVEQVNALLEQVEKTAQDMQADLSRLRVERWKTDANTRRSTLGDVQSVQRNLRDALPEIIGQLRSAPESLPATFKLYRNLDALYDVFSSVAESAGAFGSKDEYQSLATDLDQVEKNRRALAERMDRLSNSKEGEITALRVQLHDAQAALAAVPPPPKKVVDDSQPPPKPPVKKKPKVPKPPAATAAQTPKSQATTPPTTPQAAPAQPQTQPN